MFRFVSPAPTMFSGLDALQPRHVERPSAEEQYFQRLAEEHERAAALARKRLTDVRRQRQQQQALEAQLALQQQLATAFHPPQRPSYHPTRRAPQSLADVILGFGADNERESYAEYMHRQTQERQKRVEQQAAMRALFEQQRRAEAERVAELQRRRALEAKAQQERQLKAQEEARRQQAARAADEEKIRQFFQALMGAVAQEGADLERKNAIRRNSAPAQEKPKDVPVPAPAPKSAPVSPKVPERAASPAPSVASDASDASLNSIAHLQDKYDTLRSNFTFPATLVFAPSTSSPNASPSLLYNPTNAPVHAYEHALTNLLTELDAVESFGDSHVRDVRRSLARSVEAELEALEVKKRDAWRSQAVKVEVEAPVAVESAPVESAPVESAPVESAPVEVESTPAPVAESAPVESTPATESAPAPESAPVDPVEFLATRLAVPTESEDDEVKAVRENLLASLTTEPAPVSTEADKDEVVPKDEPVTEPEPTADNTTEPAATPVTETEATTAVEAEPVTGTTPTETESEPLVEFVPEPEVADAHTPTAAPEIVVSVPEPVTVAPEPEDTPASPVESVTSSSEPEVVHHEVEPTVAVQPESESVAQPESDSPTSTLPESAPALPDSEPTVAAAHQEPESATQPEPEHSAFVKVYPDSESESDSESDLASELAERKSTAGDEFELL